MTVIKVPGVKQFKKGMCLKSTYRWHGEPAKTYYYKVIKPEYKGKGATAKIYRTDTDGKKDKFARASIGEKFLWDYETQIGRVNAPDGWGRTVLIKC